MDEKQAKKAIVTAQQLGLAAIPANFWSMSSEEKIAAAETVLQAAGKLNSRAANKLLQKMSPPPEASGVRYGAETNIPLGKLWNHHPSATGERFSILCTTHLRDECLERLLASIDRYYPDIPVWVHETAGNLSRARNRLVDVCETEYALLVEEDMEFVKDTRIEPLCDVLDEDDELIMCGGVILHNWDNWCHEWDTSDGTLKAVVTRSQVKQTSGGIPYQPAQLLSNFGALRIEAAREYRWDERLELQEHRAWFWSFREKWKVAQTNECVILHDSARPGKRYNERRERAVPEFNEVAEQSVVGMPFGGSFGSFRFGQEGLPNLVILTPAHTNSTLTVRQLSCLGWNTGDVEPTYSELPAINDINRRYLRTGDFDYDAAKELLAAIGEPWVIKDPRFCETMGCWRRLLFPYKPVLVSLRKEFSRMMATANRGVFAEDVLRRYHLVDGIYEKWPHGKLELDAEAIARACALFDPSRMEYCL